jgi:hypothetical protein
VEARTAEGPPVIFQDWQGFYILAGLSAVTLVGLMFLATSAGSRVATPKDLSPLKVRASRTVVHFLYVLGTSAAVLFPTLPRTILGFILVIAGIAGCMRLVIELSVMRGSHSDIHDCAWQLLVPSVGYLLFVAGGIGLFLRIDQAASVLAVATILLLLAGTRSAWDLVVLRVLPRDVELRRETREESPGFGADITPPVPTTTPHRQAAPVPQLPKSPAADATPPQSLALSSSQQGDVARIIEKAGLKPDDFTWALQPSRYAMIGPPVSALVHLRTGCFFRFEFTKDAQEASRASVFVRSKGARDVTKPAASWADQLEQVRDWLTCLEP